MAPPRKPRRKCEVCGGPNKDQHHRTRYCSMSCSGMARRTGENRRCRRCGKGFYVPRGYGTRRGFYCSASCQLNYEYEHGIRNGAEITKAAHERTREMIRDGTHPMMHPEMRIKANRILGSKNYGRTWLEERVGWALKEMGARFIPQHPVEHGKDTLGRSRYYFIDFADPERKIGLECDGSYWHSVEKDRARQERLEALGWSIRRIPETAINRDLFGAVRAALPEVSEA